MIWPILGGSSAVVLVVALFLIFSSTDESLESISSTSGMDTIPIRIGTIHDDAAKMVKRYQPVADYIARQLSDDSKIYSGEVVIAKTSQNMIDLINSNAIDLYFDSPYVAINVSEKTNAEPILIRWKENSPLYYTVFITSIHSDISTLDDFSGKTIGFQSLDSTTGYLLPKIFLLQNQLSVSESDDADLRYVFTSDDENTAVMVAENDIDIGAISNLDYEDLPEELLKLVKIVEQTEPVYRQIVVQRQGISEEFSGNFKSILLDMDETNEGLSILDDFKHTSKFSLIEEPDQLISTTLEQLRIMEKQQ